MSTNDFDEFFTGSVQPHLNSLEAPKKREASPWMDELINSFDEETLKSAAGDEESDLRMPRSGSRDRGTWDIDDKISRAEEIRDDSERNEYLESRPVISNNDKAIMKAAHELLTQGKKPVDVIAELIEKTEGIDISSFVGKYANRIQQLGIAMKQGKVRNAIVARNEKEGAEEDIPSSISRMSGQKGVTYNPIANKPERVIKPEDDKQLMAEAKELLLNRKTATEVDKILIDRHGDRGKKFSSKFSKSFERFSKQIASMGKDGPVAQRVTGVGKLVETDDGSEARTANNINEATRITAKMLIKGFSRKEVKVKIAKKYSHAFANQFCSDENFNLITAKAGLLNPDDMMLLREIADSSGLKVGDSPDFGDKKRAAKILQLFEDKKIANRSLVKKHLKALNTDVDNNRAIIRAFMTNFKRDVQDELQKRAGEEIDPSIYADVPMENSDKRYH